MPGMDPAGKQALEHVEFAEAEFAVLKQEQVLRELVRTGVPTVEATALLRQLRRFWNACTLRGKWKCSGTPRPAPGREVKARIGPPDPLVKR